MNHVAYYRISKDDGRSRSRGLGLEAQESIVKHFYRNTIVKEFTEVKSAKNIKERPILQDALAYCLANGCALVVAKVDRLSRNVDDCRLILQELKGNLLACDIPGPIDKFTLTLFAAFAEREREMISLRTSQALQAKLKREGTWQKGNDLFKNAEFREKAYAANRLKASTNGNNVRATEIIALKKQEGFNFVEIANYLNHKQFKTSKGKDFGPVQVQRLFDKMQSLVVI